MTANDKPALDGCDLSVFMERTKIYGAPGFRVAVGPNVYVTAIRNDGYWLWRVNGAFVGESVARALIQEMVFVPRVQAKYPLAYCAPYYKYDEPEYPFSTTFRGWRVMSDGADVSRDIPHPTEFAAWYVAALKPESETEAEHIKRTTCTLCGGREWGGGTDDQPQPWCMNPSCKGMQPGWGDDRVNE